MSTTHSKAEGEGISDEAVKAMADEAEQSGPPRQSARRLPSNATRGS